MTITDTRTDVSELWYTRCPVPTASSLAISTGLLDAEFAADGIEVRSLLTSGDERIRQSHFDHTQPRSFRQGGNIPPIWSASRGTSQRLVGLSWVEHVQHVVARADSGITSVEDLAGRRIGVARRVNDQIDFWRATALRGLEVALESGGLQFGDVTLVDLEETRPYIPADSSTLTGSLFSAFTNKRLQANEVEALVRGEVDAIYVNGMRAVDVEAFFSLHVVVDVGALPEARQRVSNIAPVAFTASTDLIDERPDLVARYLAASQRAAAWAQDHEDEARRIIANEVGFVEEFVDPSFGPGLHTRLEVSLAEDLVDGIRVQKDFLLRHGFITSDVDLDAWIDPRPLRAAAELLAG
ncbi:MULTISPECIES: ABC transporter substrate-binding protein [unclassified Aeromicrobium]|uniref:ABC transporter substrate-binding protein n=1 Tax=unclassified Aeromicrobium TaxID=2633570 RepID=UPI00396AF28F